MMIHCDDQCMSVGEDAVGYPIGRDRVIPRYFVGRKGKRKKKEEEEKEAIFVGPTHYYSYMHYWRLGHWLSPSK